MKRRHFLGLAPAAVFADDVDPLSLGRCPGKSEAGFQKLIDSMVESTCLLGNEFNLMDWIDIPRPWELYKYCGPADLSGIYDEIRAEQRSNKLGSIEPRL